MSYIWSTNTANQQSKSMQKAVCTQSAFRRTRRSKTSLLHIRVATGRMVGEQSPQARGTL